jgi:hypothetical protein
LERRCSTKLPLQIAPYLRIRILHLLFLRKLMPIKDQILQVRQLKAFRRKLVRQTQLRARLSENKVETKNSTQRKAIFLLL